MEIADLLQMVVDEDASDLHLTVGVPPSLRVSGHIIPLNMPPLEPKDTEKLMRGISSDEHIEKVRKEGGTDFGFSFGKVARFRVSVYRQRGSYGISLRLIPSKLMSLEEIGFSSLIQELLFKPRGLVLVTGPTGCGKSTTLASMINTINQMRDLHIMTIEDPIEYYHSHNKCIINQREVGVDVPSFTEAIVRGVRMDPDVMMIGEMRDLETMEAAIRAAETGHLVFATLHTTGAARTVDRIIDAFPTDQQEQIRTQIATSIVAVISQLLLPRASGKGRVASFEIMVATPSIQNLIRDKKTYRIHSDIQTGAKYGMVTMDAHLSELYQRGDITFDTMMSFAFDLEEVGEKADQADKNEKRKIR